LVCMCEIFIGFDTSDNVDAEQFAPIKP
jgi:hypothetical protein